MIVSSFLQNGELIESGSHEELMKIKGEYHRLYTLQAEFLSGPKGCIKPVPLYDKGGSAMSKQQEIKLIIWDLDNTLWQGTLGEKYRNRLDRRQSPNH